MSYGFRNYDGRYDISSRFTFTPHGEWRLPFHQVKAIGSFLGEFSPPRILEQTNEYRLDLSGVMTFEKARYGRGEIVKIRAYKRGERTLPADDELFGFVLHLIEREHHWPGIIKAINAATEKYRPDPELRIKIIHRTLMAIEAMINDGWVIATRNPALPLEDLRVTSIDIRPNTDQRAVVGGS